MTGTKAFSHRGRRVGGARVGGWGWAPYLELVGVGVGVAHTLELAENADGMGHALELEAGKVGYRVSEC
jgi:hypothetical protein